MLVELGVFHDVGGAVVDHSHGVVPRMDFYGAMRLRLLSQSLGSGAFCSVSVTEEAMIPNFFYVRNTREPNVVVARKIPGR